MNTTPQVLFAAVIAATLSLAIQANAQYKVNEADGIAASPRVRQSINERKASEDVAAASVKNAYTSVYRVVDSDGIAASPKVRQSLDEKRGLAVATPSQPSGVAAYQAAGDDGIAASPKLRQQLNERPRKVMIAPVK